MPTDNKSIHKITIYSSLSQNFFNKNNNKQILKKRKKRKRFEKYSSKFSFDKMISNVSKHFISQENLFSNDLGHLHPYSIVFSKME